MTPPTDREDRHLALKLAVQAGTKFDDGGITPIAERFYKFLQTGQEPPASTDSGVTATREDLKDFSGIISAGTFTRGGIYPPPTPGQRLKYSVDRLSDSAKEVLNHALTEALQMGHNTITPEFLLLGILRQGQSKAHAALIDLAGDGKAVRKAVIGKLVDKP